MKKLYPLKFKAVFKERIWGGQKIRTSLGLNFSPLPNCGEAWVISGVPSNQTVVSNGFLRGNELNELVEVYMDDLVGEKIFEKSPNEFPILVKFIDSNEYLSIQVHPDDDLAAKRGIGSGKTEMWYILDSEKDAELINGFSKPVTRDIYLEHLEKNTLKSILNVEKVCRDEVYFIPSGRIHALGPGILLAEIQQTSDTTYRIYDWDRVDSQGKPRELHTDLALDAINFSIPDTYRTNYRKEPNQSVNLVDSPWFVTNLIEFDKVFIKNYTELDSFVIYICIDGDARMNYDGGNLELRKGETVLIPALMEKVQLFPDRKCKILEVYIP